MAVDNFVIDPASAPKFFRSGSSNQVYITSLSTNNNTVSYTVAFSGPVGVGAVMAPSIDLLEYSIRALESIGDCDRRVYASLLHLMRHSNPDIKNASRYAILGMVRNHHASAPELIGALRDWRYLPEKNESPALEVATRLAAECVRSVPEMTPLLVDAIGNKDSNLKAIAARGLGETRQPSRDVVTALFQATAETNNNVRAIAIASLKPLCRHNDDALASCNAALDNPNYLIRAAAADILREVDIGVLEPRAPTCLPKLRELLADPEREVRYQSALTLWWVAGDGKPIADLRISDLSSHDQLARLDAVDFLGRLDADAERAVPGLIETLSHDGSDEVRIHAATALGNIGQKARLALPALIIAFEDPRESVRASALGAISRIDPAAAHRLESR
jgi:HEAT repeat protein